MHILVQIQRIQTLASKDIKLFYFSKCNIVRIAQLLVSLENIQRLFIDDIASNADFIGINMLQFFEILKVYDHCENLRKSSVLNPTNDGDHMSQPARMTVKLRVYLFVHLIFLFILM